MVISPGIPRTLASAPRARLGDRCAYVPPTASGGGVARRRAAAASWDFVSQATGSPVGRIARVPAPDQAGQHPMVAGQPGRTVRQV